MSQPKFLTEDQYRQECGALSPVYPLKKELTNTRLQNALKEVLPLCDDIREYLPAETLAGEGLLSIPQAIRQMHFPKSMEEVYAARKRLAFDEFSCSWHVWNC